MHESESEKNAQEDENREKGDKEMSEVKGLEKEKKRV